MRAPYSASVAYAPLERGRPLHRPPRLALVLVLGTLECEPGEARRVTVDSAKKRPERVAAAALASRAATVPFRVPDESEIKDTVVLAAVRRGRALVSNTRDSLPSNV